MKLVFMGTPAFAATILKHLLKYDQAEVVAVFTQPDRPCGRGQQCRPSEVKILAIEAGLPIFQPLSLKNPDALRQISDLAPDIMVVAAYGLMLPGLILSLPPLGCLNVHASLLPRYRGAAPIQRAIMAGERETGVSIMLMEETLDTGPVLLAKSTPIGPDETAGELHDRLAEMGGALLLKALDSWRQGCIKAAPQNNAEATYAAKIDKTEGKIDWKRTAAQVHNHIRGLTPWPGAYYDWKRPDKTPMRLTLLPGSPGAKNENTPPGAMLGLIGEALGIACADRLYLVKEVIPANRARQNSRAFACGYLNECP